MDFFRKLFGSSKQPAAENAPATPAPGNAETPYEMTEAEAAKQTALEASSERLDLHWQSIGTVERDVLAYLISPSFTGGPYWRPIGSCAAPGASFSPPMACRRHSMTAMSR